MRNARRDIVPESQHQSPWRVHVACPHGRERQVGGGSYGISIKLVVNIFLYWQGSLLDIIVI